MNTVTKIFWKRTYLFIEYTGDSAIELCLRNKATGRKVPMESKALCHNYYRAKLNITIANGRDLLEPGSWEIVDGGSDMTLPCSECILSDPFAAQRAFRYTARFYSYTFRLMPCGQSVTIENRHYMSVKKKKDELLFRESFFN